VIELYGKDTCKPVIKIAKIAANNIRVNKQIIANVIVKISNIKKSIEQTRSNNQEKPFVEQ